MRAPISCQSKRIFTKWRIFIRVTELTPRLFVEKAKPVFFLFSSQRKLLNKFFCYWIITGLFVLNNIDKSNMADL